MHTSDLSSDLPAHFLSHEIRSLLYGIIGYTELLRGCNMETPALEYIQKIESCEYQLLKLINAHLSNASGSHLPETTEKVSPELLVKESIDMVYPQANIKGLTLSIHHTNNLPHQILVDATRLKQALLNLLNNAIHYTDNGTITISIEYNKPAAGCTIGEITFSVTDTGTGIKPDSLPHLTAPFYRGKSSQRQHKDGCGLGLAITEKLLTHIGGTLQIESKEGTGSRFSFSIPVETEIPFSLSTALVADDDDIIRVLTVSLLQKVSPDITVYTAKDGCKAVEMWRTHMPELVLMDINMPHMNGETAAREIRCIENQQNHSPSTQIIAVTAAEDAEQHLQPLFDSVLTKPVSSGSIRKLLLQLRGQYIY
ncbi:MAG: hybrid sensor histidine kinase/response regulator [Spirochaeta sp.]